VKPEHVIREILEYDIRHDLDGVTFSGGEPMQQANALLTIMRELRRRSPKLSLGMFTGYTERELDEGKFSTVLEALATDEISLWHTIPACSILRLWAATTRHRRRAHLYAVVETRSSGYSATATLVTTLERRKWK
jgi:organic radical activating enzyme